MWLFFQQDSINLPNIGIPVDPNCSWPRGKAFICSDSRLTCRMGTLSGHSVLWLSSSLGHCFWNLVNTFCHAGNFKADLQILDSFVKTISNLIERWFEPLALLHQCLESSSVLAAFQFQRWSEFSVKNIYIYILYILYIFIYIYMYINFHIFNIFIYIFKYMHMNTHLHFSKLF